MVAEGTGGRGLKRAARQYILSGPWELWPARPDLPAKEQPGQHGRKAFRAYI